MDRSLARYDSDVRCLPILVGLVAGGCDLVIGLELRDAAGSPDSPPDAVLDAHPTFGALMLVALQCPTGSAFDLSLDQAESLFMYGCSGSNIDIFEAPVINELRRALDLGRRRHRDPGLARAQS